MSDFWNTLRPEDGTDSRIGVFAVEGEPSVDGLENWSLADPGGRVRVHAELDLPDEQLIAELRSRGADLPDEQIEILLAELLHGCAFRLPPIRFEALYRARIVGSAESTNAIKSSREAWYPPPQLVRGFGRANSPGESVFYASFLRNVAVCEVRPRVGDSVTVLRAIPIADTAAYFFPLGVSLQLPEHLRARADPTLTSIYVHESDRRRAALIHEFFVDEFTREAASGSPRAYAVTAILTRMIFRAVPAIAGVAYPSVVTRRASIAVALPPCEADRLVRPESCVEFHVEGDDDVSFRTRVVRTSSTIERDGTIHWL